MRTIEEVLATLAQVDDPALADVVLVELLFDSPTLLEAAQWALDQLRDHGHPRQVEHLDGGWWRIDGGLERVTEAAGQPGVPVPHARLHLHGLAGARPLWIHPSLTMPSGLLAVAWEAAQVAPLAIARPGRLAVGPYILDLGPGVGGRTAHQVELHGGGPPVLGTTVEVAWGEPPETFCHELVHALGSTSEAEAGRLGALLARSAGRRW
jgi:hypothetical protein